MDVGAAAAIQLDGRISLESDPGFTLWASVGRFGWKTRFSDSAGIRDETRIKDGEPYPEKVAAVIKAGFFESGGQHDDKYRDVKEAFDRLVNKVSEQWRWSRAGAAVQIGKALRAALF